MWASKDNGNDIGWHKARAYCQNYHGGNYTDWRLPTQNELATLYDPKISNYYHITPLIKLSSSSPWSSEVRGSGADYFNFYRGERRYWNGDSLSIGGTRALPVRSVK